MSKRISFQQGISSVLFWSIISAAFIGPGTVTTTSRAGASFGLSLLWTLVFSTVATILLQETAARITLASGKNLGEIIARQYGQGNSRRIHWFVFLALAFGCAAYEAGNLLGAISGLAFFTNVPRPLVTAILGITCAVLLWSGNYQFLARLLGAMVAVMGIAFIYVALKTPFSPFEFIRDSFVPAFPAGSALLIIGLIGTTIVPYNLFLGSGIGQGQSMAEMRWGIVIAVFIGGLISIAILVAGTQVIGEYSYENLASTLTVGLGKPGRILFGLGLFAAGLSSAITAPLAAAITARSLFGREESGEQVFDKTRFRAVWGVVLGIGVIFGVLNFRPIPVIILAQALNGLLLPVMTVFLLFAANDQEILGSYTNGRVANVVTIFIVGITTVLGLHNISLALDAAIDFAPDGSMWPLYLIMGLAVALMLLLGWRVLRKH